MSWQDYVDVQLKGSGSVAQACIAGLDGNVWAKSEEFNVLPEEIKKIVAGFADKDGVQMSGVRIGGEKFIYISSDDKLMRAKMGKRGLHIVKTKQAVVVALYEDPVQPQQCAIVVEKLADYLISCGY
jgi:profilin